MAVDTATIGQLDPRTTLLSTDLFEIAAGGLSFSVTTQQLANFVATIVPAILSINGDSTQAQIIAAGDGMGIVDAGATHTLAVDATVARSTDNLSFFAATTSAQLAGIISDETGSGLLVFGTNPVIVTPTIASFVNAVHNHLTNAGGGTITAAAISDFDTAVAANAAVTANTAKVTNANHTGDASGATILTIANDAVTYAKMQNVVADNVLLGNVAGAGGIVTELTGAQVNLFLPVFTSTLNGLVPLSGGGTTNFLRADGTFAVPVDTAGITTLNSDTVAVQTLTGGDGITITDATPDHSFAVDATVARSTDNLSFFAATTSAQLLGVISDETGSGLLVFGTSPTIVTPTIVSFVNATHNHQAAAGGGTLLSTAALSDTANIAYLNTTNAYVAGTRQDFLGLLAGTSGLNVGGIAGNPTTQVNGDIWLNSSTNQIFGRINGVDVDLGQSGSEVTTWTANHSMATFKLTASAANDVILLAPTGQGVSIEVNAVQEYLFNATEADYLGNDIRNVGFVESNATNPASSGVLRIGNAEAGPTWRNAANSNNIDLIVTAGDALLVRINGSTQLSQSATELNLQNNNLVVGSGIIQFRTANASIQENATNGLEIDVATGESIFLRANDVTEYEASPTAFILNTNILQFNDVNTTLVQSGADIQYDVATGGTHDFRINNVLEAELSATQLSLLGNNLVSAVMTGTVTGVSAITGLGVQAQTFDLGGNNLDNIQNLIQDLSTSGTDVDFGEDMLQEISIAANTTFTGTGYTIGKSKILKITTDSTLRTLAFPANWTFIGTKPTDQAASKIGILSLISYTAADTGVVAVYNVED